MNKKPIIFIAVPIFLIILGFLAFPIHSQRAPFRIMNVSFLFGGVYTGGPGFAPTNFIGECGGDLPQVCKDLSFSLPEGPGKQSGLGVDRTLCVMPNGTKNYQYSCDTTGPSSNWFIDKIDPINRVLTYKSGELKGPIQFVIHDILATGFRNGLHPFVFNKAVPPLYSAVNVSSDPDGLVVIKPEQAVRNYNNILLANNSCIGELSDQFTDDFYRMNRLTAAKNGFTIIENSCTGPVGQKLKYHVQVYQRQTNYEKQITNCKPGNVYYNQFFDPGAICGTNCPITGPEPNPFPYMYYCQSDPGYRPLLPRDYEQTGQWGWPNYFTQKPQPGTYVGQNQYDFCEAFDMQYEDQYNANSELISYIEGATDWPRCFVWGSAGGTPPVIKQLQKVLVWGFPYIFNTGSCGPFDALRGKGIGGGKAGFNNPMSYYRQAADIMCKKPIHFNDKDYETAERSSAYIFEPSKIKTDQSVEFLNRTVRPFFEQTDRLNQEYFSGPSSYKQIQFHVPVLTLVEVTDLQGNPIPSKQQTLQNTTVTLFTVEIGQKVKVKIKAKQMDGHNTSVFVFQSSNFGWGMFGPTQGGQVPVFGCSFNDTSVCLLGDKTFNKTTTTGPLHQNIGTSLNETEVEFVYQIPPTYRAPLVGTTSLNPGDPYPLFVGSADEYNNFDSAKILFEIVPPICANNQHDTSVGETDADCGGNTCPQCGLGDRCEADTDCQSGYCFKNPAVPPVTGGSTSAGILRTQPFTGYGSGICRTPTCSDGIQNQGETAVDCGGPCAACGGCVENWVTSPWSRCTGGQQTRTVRDTNTCNNPVLVVPKPAIQRACVNLGLCTPIQKQCGGPNGCQILPYLNGISCGPNLAGLCFAGSCYLPGTQPQVGPGQCLKTDWSPCEKHNIGGQIGFFETRTVVIGKFNVACSQLPPDQRPGAYKTCSPQAGPGPRDLCQQSLISSGFDPRFSTDFTALANLNNVEGFKIGNQFGQVEFLGKTDLSNVDCTKLGSIFRIETNKIFVDTKTQPTFNQQALVTLFTKNIKDPIVKTLDNQCIQVQVIRWVPDTGLLTFRAQYFGSPDVISSKSGGYQVVEKETSGCVPQTSLALLLALSLIPIGAIGFLLFYLYYRNKKLQGHEFLWEKYIAQGRSEK